MIGQPKSASTSLMITLSKCFGVEAGQVLGLTNKGNKKFTIDKYNYKYDNEFIYLHGHSDMVDMSGKLFLKLLLDEKKIYKQHFAPSKNNIDIILKNIGNSKLLVLLRKPKHVYNSYIRWWRRKNINKPRDYRHGVYTDFIKYYNIYKALKHKNIMVIDYDDLVLDFNNTLEKIILFYGKPIPDNINNIELSKHRFTGVGLKRLEHKRIKIF